MNLEYQVNALGPLRVTQALLPNVMAGERKIVASVSSMMGSMELNTFGCCLGYRASKAALNSLTRTAATELSGRKIRVNSVNPGPVNTPIFNKTGMPQEALHAFAGAMQERIPLKDFYALQRCIRVSNIVIGERFALELFIVCDGTRANIDHLLVESSTLMWIFSISHVFNLVEA